MTAPARLDNSPDPPALGDILRINARLHADRVAIVFEGRATSYRDLATTALRVANALNGAGLSPGDRIGVIGRNSDTFFQILFGAAMIGVVTVPLNWRLNARELTFIIEDADIRLLFAEADAAALAAASIRTATVSPRMIVGGEPFATWRDAAADDDPAIAIDPETVVIQLYTSGTTGHPKGALLTHRSLNSVRVSQPPDVGWSRWAADDICLISMPLFHVGGIGTALASIYHGARMVIAREFAPESVFDFIERDRITKLFLVPTAMRIALDHPRARTTDYTALRYILYGSSSITLSLLAEAIRVFGCGFVQVYGLTETSGTVVALSPEDHAAGDATRLRAAGRPLAGVEIAILDAAGAALPDGKIGEVAIRSAANMAGYWRLPDATAACLTPDGFLRSGDAGYLDADGYLYIVDRVKDMIITGGENIYAAEVEAVLCAHPAVAEAAVVGVPDARWGEAVKAVVVLGAGCTASPDELRTWASERLARFKVPRTIVYLPALPRNAAGKVLRRALG